MAAIHLEAIEPKTSITPSEDDRPANARLVAHLFLYTIAGFTR